ncbi:thiamine pyrophosphate-binding protein [Denitrobaculum tricleocarpae]|uniref:Thiamine pyrophosphate-binding protein n=1 Tax=Denitrobaculum tricleocarpae TaxID=2591009 RepID=A0A545TPD3_9PROT|nr:thiamine pyrophosphate-binding protein [Denitrobaculum tricleocarpae]TQV79038.1 thiamine pyrophosphate-binding protein [Denitrobaculum tricleocarpae]
MTSQGKLRTGGRILVDQLRLHGVDTAFGVPGESYLAVLDAFYDVPEIAFRICRQEGGAAMMADAYGKLTGQPGICFVTRGPGATSASAGVHIAYQDSTPMILFIGQVGRDMIEREAFQEIDYRRMFGQMAKWVAQIDDADRIPEYLARAFATATSGRPGPVVLALPEDMLRDMTAAPDAKPYRPAEAHPSLADMKRLGDLVAAAKRPLMILGGTSWNAQACRHIQSFAEAHGLPTTASFRCQDYFDNRHPNYAGDVGIGINPKLADRVRESDLVLVVGARLGEMTTGGYTLFDTPVPKQTMVHVHAGAEELGRVYQPELAINAGVKAFAAAAAALSPPKSPDKARKELVSTARNEYEAYIETPSIPGDVQMGEIMAWLRERLPEDAIISNGAGNYTTWVHRFYQYRSFPTQLAPTSGSMGYGLPAAVAASSVFPERTVVCFAGDGCYMMHGQELATAMQYGLKIIILVINNGMYGTIRMHQEREYPERVSGTELVNPDFAAYARAFGANGEVVERTEQFAPAFERAMAAEGSSLIEIRIDPEAITPKTTLAQITAAAQAKLS